MTARAAALVALTLVATASETTAQSRVRLGAHTIFGDIRLDAAQTFEAASDTSHTRVLGAGVRLTDLWGFVFVDVAVSSTTLDGERVLFDVGVVRPLGISLDVSLLYVDVAAGWRYVHGRLSRYLGGGFSRLRYRDTSEFADAGEDVTESGTDPVFVAGVDFALSRWVRVGGELRYRRIPGLESGSESARFDEDSARGISAALRVSIGR
jgi:Outer membrane protein beta-barrel domain